MENGRRSFVLRIDVPLQNSGLEPSKWSENKSQNVDTYQNNKVKGATYPYRGVGGVLISLP